VEYDDSTCLSWKEILILTNDNDKVNSFLVENNVLISPNYILPKAMYYVVFRYDISRYRQREERVDDNRETSGDQVCMSESM
jgi:hypothetical protein